MKQTFHDKGNGGYGGGIASGDWERFIEFDGTKLKQSPLAKGTHPVGRGHHFDDLAQQLAACQPPAVVGNGPPTRDLLAEAQTKAHRLLSEKTLA